MDDEEKESGAEVSTSQPEKRKSFLNVQEELTPEEALSPGVLKLLIADNRTKDDEIRALKKIEAMYNSESFQNGERKEKSRKCIRYEIFGDLFTGIAGLLAGLSTFNFAMENAKPNVLMMVFAIVMIVGAQIVKWVKL